MAHRTELSSSNSDCVAVVYLEEGLIDDATTKQISSMISSSCITHARVMPDCHVGHGCCVGFTAYVDISSIVPSYVGGDIGCGVLTYSLMMRRINAARVEKIIRQLIPMGEGRKGSHDVAVIEQSFIERYLSHAQGTLDHFCQRYCIEPVVLNYEYFTSLCERIGADVGATMRSFGTLGSGNHFIEVNQSANSGDFYLTVHSGSRGFGMKLFEYHNQLLETNKCLSNENSITYCLDLICAQYLAKMNRHIMLQIILRELDVEFSVGNVIESIHNYVDFSGIPILRKGAISANVGEICIVALNMRDGILLCEGKGNEDWNCSCAHGCGRIMSRSEARKRIKLKEYRKCMENVVSTSVCEETLDEAPQAYKDMNIIMEALSPTVDIVDRLVSIVNVKGHD